MSFKKELQDLALKGIANSTEFVNLKTRLEEFDFQFSDDPNEAFLEANLLIQNLNVHATEFDKYPEQSYPIDGYKTEIKNSLFLLKSTKILFDKKKTELLQEFYLYCIARTKEFPKWYFSKLVLAANSNTDLALLLIKYNHERLEFLTPVDKLVNNFLKNSVAFWKNKDFEKIKFQIKKLVGLKNFKTLSLLIETHWTEYNLLEKKQLLLIFQEIPIQVELSFFSEQVLLENPKLGLYILPLMKSNSLKDNLLTSLTKGIKRAWEHANNDLIIFEKEYDKVCKKDIFPKFKPYDEGLYLDKKFQFINFAYSTIWEEIFGKYIFKSLYEIHKKSPVLFTRILVSIANGYSGKLMKSMLAISLIEVKISTENFKKISRFSYKLNDKTIHKALEFGLEKRGKNLFNNIDLIIILVEEKFWLWELAFSKLFFQKSLEYIYDLDRRTLLKKVSSLTKLFELIQNRIHPSGVVFYMGKIDEFQMNLQYLPENILENFIETVQLRKDIIEAI